MKDPLSFVVVLDHGVDRPNVWSTAALSVPDAKVDLVIAGDGRPMTPARVLEDGVVLEGVADDTAVKAVVRVPSDLMTSANLERQKFTLEQEKHVLAQQWQKRTYVWSICAALIALGGTLGSQAFLRARKAPSVTTDQLSECRNSLKRAVTLTTQIHESAASLGNAIRSTDQVCDDLLVQLIGQVDHP